AASVIVARDVLACVPWRGVDALLAVLGKKLRPRGVLSLRVPDGEAIARAYAGGSLSHHEAQRLLFGDQEYPEDTRRGLWSAGEVERRLAMIGLQIERLEHRGTSLSVRARRVS